MLNTFYDCYRILNHVYSEKTYIKQAINSEPIEPLNKNAVIKICYGVVEKDITLEYFISQLCDKRPKLAIRILLKIAIYNIYFLNKAPYAVANNVVELCKKLGKSGVSGFLNATVRRFTAFSSDIKYPSDKIKAYSVKFSYPEFAVRMLLKDYDEQTAIEIMQFNEVKTYLRFNNCDGEAFLQKLDKKYEKTPFENLFSVTNFTREQGFFDGKYTFQSIGSVAICDVVNSGDKLLDACAAPGGKSVLLSAKFKSVTACELHEHRAGLIKEYAARMGTCNIDIKVCDSSVFNHEFSNQFDAVLCDSPCSGFGVIYENPDIKINRSFDNISELTDLQTKILQNCSKYVKKNGYLYYSTCSIFKAENDLVVNNFLKNNSDFKAVDIQSPLGNIKCEHGLQFLPHISMGAGFYVSKLQKL